MRTRLVPIVLILAFCNGTVLSADRRSELNGRIVAYRPADRMQVASFVTNQEFFLFRPDGKSKELLKLVYRHQGYSDLKGDVVDNAEDITITVRRSVSCDQTLAAFEKGARSVPLKGDGGGATERIVFTTKSPLSVTKSYRLKCYVLEHWKPVVSGQPK